MASNGFLQHGQTYYAGTPTGQLFQGSDASGLFDGSASSGPRLFDGLPSFKPTLFNGQTGTSRPRNSNPLFDGNGRPVPFDLIHGPAVPHVGTFSAQWNAASRTYPWRWDEAYTKSREDALAMRRDPFIMALVKERQYASTQCPWHVEAEDRKDVRQIQAAKRATDIVQATPDLQSLLMSVAENIWYGRSGVQVLWGRKRVSGANGFAVREHWPVNGDKIQFTWEGVPEVLIYTPIAKDLEARGGEIRITDRNYVLVLSKPEWRDRFIIAKHDIVDADFFDSQKAGSVHGVGLRDWLYYYWWLKQEMLSYITDFMERVGTGFTIGRYPAGDSNAQQQMMAVLQNQTRESYITAPFYEGMEGASGIERVEPSTSGAEVLRTLVEYYDQHMERFVVGQTMSGGADNESGLGGSGRANFAKATKQAITEHDCAKMEGALTRDFLGPIQKYNDLGFDEFRLRWKFDLNSDDPKQQLDAAKSAWEMGVSFDEDELRAKTGFAKPEGDGTIIRNPQIAQAEQQMQQAAQQPPPGGLFEGQPQQGGGAMFEGKPKAETAPAKSPEPAAPMFEGKPKTEEPPPVPPKPPEPAEVPSPDRDSAARHAADQAEDARNGLRPDDRPHRNALVESSVPAIAYLYAPPSTKAAAGVNAADWQRFARWAQSQEGDSLKALGKDGHSDPSGELTAVDILNNELAQAIDTVDPDEGIGPTLHLVARDVLDVLLMPQAEGVVASTERPENLSTGLFHLRRTGESERECATCAAFVQGQCRKFAALGLSADVAEDNVCDLWNRRGDGPDRFAKADRRVAYDRSESPPINVTINNPPQPAPVVHVAPADVNVAAPVVTVNVPEQAAPVVNVAFPEQQPPIVQVSPPDISVAAPVVNVNVPEQSPPVVNVAAPTVNVSVPRPGRKVLDKDDRGNIVGMHEEDAGS